MKVAVNENTLEQAIISELQQKGYKTVAGQVSRKYFNERTMVA